MRAIQWQFGRPKYFSQPKQWFIWAFGLFLEWDSDGFELSYYRNPGDLCVWKWICTRSGNPIQDSLQHNPNKRGLYVRIKRVMRYDPTQHKFRLFRLLWTRGIVGDGEGYSAKLAVSLRPKLYQFSRDFNE